MTRAAVSVYMYGLYYVTMIAPPFLLFPHFALGVFGLSAGDDMWIRYVGVQAAIIGGFYIGGVLTRKKHIYLWSVPARFATGSFLALMVMLGNAGLLLLIFAALDVLTGFITWMAIKADTVEANEKKAA